MPYVVTLTDYAPPAREDELPFTMALIEEAPLRGGAWTVIDEQALEPRDRDPARPITREFTTEKATLEGGFYRVRWKDGEGRLTAPTAAVQQRVEGTDLTRPTVAEVGALLRARTKERGGDEVGTFTERTRPTADEVEELIDDAVREVGGKVTAPAYFAPADDDTREAYEERIRGAARLYAAILVETSYFPEQLKADKSAATVYQGLYASRIKALISEGESGHPMGEGGAGTGGVPGDPAWAFPLGTAGMVGLNSRW